MKRLRKKIESRSRRTAVDHHGLGRRLQVRRCLKRTAWYRSLYWRIGLGFVLFLAVVLLVQGAALRLAHLAHGGAPGPPSPRLTRARRRELSDALDRESQARRRSVSPAAGLRAAAADGRRHARRPRRLEQRRAPSGRCVCCEPRARMAQRCRNRPRDSAAADRGRGDRGVRATRRAGRPAGSGAARPIRRAAATRRSTGAIVVNDQLIGRRGRRIRRSTCRAARPDAARSSACCSSAAARRRPRC